MQEIHFIRDYNKSFDASIFERIKILNTLSVKNGKHTFADGIIYYTDNTSRDITNEVSQIKVINCVKSYYNLPKKLCSGDTIINLIQCYKIRQRILNDTDENNCFKCYQCHMECTSKYLNGELKTKKRHRCKKNVIQKAIDVIYNNDNAKHKKI